ncbi:MAG: gas vesicle synthesis GvpLGvpF [Syntrophus sp. (in: bacteria)]|nr:gas vesicle synthesis GvpLGvpF [Syntrophus sp. (in: bacteria)]MBA4418906.1 gas vesicle synthesis GvpLGvpF [Syntrophus sp. (in: bacteria)]
MEREYMEEGIYIYCIIESREPLLFGAIGIGERGDDVYTLSFQDLGAVVSKSPVRKYPVARENLMPHERVIEEVMKTHTVLPVRFCTIAKDEEKVKKILEKEYDRFKALLESLENKKELGIKAIFKEDMIYTHILEQNEEIRKLKDKLTGMPPEKTHYQRMEIGKMVEVALQGERESCKDSILSLLSPLAIETKTNPVYGEMMVLNAAFLVHEKDEPMFDTRVNELAESRGDTVRFKYVGKIPPFNFVNLTIRTEEY